MGASGSFDVQEVLEILEGRVVCIVRCVSGVVEEGDRVGVSPIVSEIVDASMRIVEIRLPVRRAALLNPPISAKVELAGDGLNTVSAGRRFYTFK